MFLCHTATTRELQLHSKNVGRDIQCYANFSFGELKKFVKILIVRTKEEHFNADANANLITNQLKLFIDRKFTTYEECFGMVFINQLKRLRENPWI